MLKTKRFVRRLPRKDAEIHRLNTVIGILEAAAKRDAALITELEQEIRRHKLLADFSDEIEKRDAAIERLKAVTDEILAIMAVYHEQENSSRGVGTPGGLEHMGDVWRLLSKWEDKLIQRAREATR